MAIIVVFEVFSNMEKSRGQLTYMGALPIRRVPTISKLENTSNTTIIAIQGEVYNNALMNEQV
jgi:hypothetical protein